MLFFKRWKIHSKSDLIFSRSFLFLHLSFFSRRKLPIERLFSMAKVFLLRSLCVWISSENCFSIFQRLCLPSNCQFKIGKINFPLLNCICFQSIEHETIANTQSWRVCACLHVSVALYGQKYNLLNCLFVRRSLRKGFYFRELKQCRLLS